MRWPGSNRSAPLPAPSTYPTIMRPITRGSFGSFSSPLTMYRSVRQAAQTETRIRTWRSDGTGTGTSSRRRGSFAARSRIALIVLPLGGDAALQCCAQRDGRGCQRFRDGTVLLGIVGEALEGCLIDPRHVAFGCQIDAGDSPTLVALVEMDAGRGPNYLWLVAGLREAVGERHRKASGMRRAHQLFGIGAGPVLHPTLEGIRSLEGAATQAHRSRSILQRPPPRGFRCTYWHVRVTSL